RSSGPSYCGIWTANGFITGPALFTQVAPICAGETLAPLSTTSNNGVTGTWSPILDNIVTTTYTFTPDTGQCTVNPATMTIIVNPIEALFTQVAPICSGETLAPLPTTSNNGVTGTWSPLLDNTVTTTYTFTPDAGQCTVNPATMTIVVNPIEALFTQVAPICSGETLDPLPTTSNNGVTGTWSPAPNNTATTTYTFTPDAGQCTVNPATMTIIVNPLEALFTQVDSICFGQTLAPLPSTSNNGVTGTWSPVLDTTATATYTFTPDAGQCAPTTATTTMTIVVNPIITPTFTTIAPFCSGLESPILPTTSNNSVVGTWSPTTVSNTDSATYTFIPNADQCASTTTLDVTIIPKTIPLFDPIADVCYNSTPPSLPLTSTNGITGTWNPSTVSNTVSEIYTFTPSAGICAATITLTINVNAITPLFDVVSSICANATAPLLPSTSTNGIIGSWNPTIVSNTASADYVFTPDAGQCATSTTLNVTVNEIITPTFTSIAPICSDAVPPVLPLTSDNSITGTWNPATISNTLSGTYTFTPTEGQCATSTNLTVEVRPNVTPIFAEISPLCSGETSPVLPLTSTNGVIGTWNPASVSNTLSGNYIFTPDAGQCGLTASLSVTVYQSPTSITLKTTDVINEQPDGIIEITGVTSGLEPYTYSINNSSFTSNTTYSNLNPGEYTITVLDSNGCVFSKKVTVNSVCLIPNLITPNNDTFNDTFDLTGCDIAKLRIYNRYGVEVNDFQNYSNQWDGKNKKGEFLADGTYYYVAENKNGIVKSGWIYVTR
ncbi:gliding motility-associated C-terminal domain-containing protein, partial [Flavobacterium sp.]|uniref:gliding motility-associated C-terminal domain-containing protein n=1 Tax=Flavobacterium sp. TaxID=239 RepID=UPI00286D973B